MNLYINYQFNFSDTLSVKGQTESPVEMEHLLNGLTHLMNNVSAAALHQTVFKLLMEYLLNHSDTSKKEMKEVYVLLDFLKFVGELQGEDGVEGLGK